MFNTVRLQTNVPSEKDMKVPEKEEKDVVNPEDLSILMIRQETYNPVTITGMEEKQCTR